MPSVTADTNIYISGYQIGGVPRRFLDLAAEGEFRLDICPAIVTETIRVLRGKFLWDAQALRDIEADILGYTNLVMPLDDINFIQSDPDDNRILECAVKAQSDFIVSGDTRHVLPLGIYEGIRIVKVAEFLALLQRL